MIAGNGKGRTFAPANHEREGMKELRLCGVL